MPSVPKYQGNIQQQGFKTDRVAQEAPLAAFGGGDAMQGAYSAAQKLVGEVEQRIDQTAIIEADTQMTVARQAVLDKVKSMKMKDAGGAPEEAKKIWDAELEKINSNLIGRQQAKFAGLASQGWQSVYSATEDHVRSESAAWAEQTTKSGIKSKQSLAVNEYKTAQGGTNFNLIEQSLRDQSDIRDAEAATKGYAIDSDINKNNKLADSTETHAAVISDMINSGNDIDAQKYFDRYEKQIDRDAARVLLKDLNRGSSRSSGLQAAYEAVDKNMSNKKAEKYFNEKFPGNTDAILFARQQYEHLKNQDEVSKTEHRRNVMVNVGKILRENKGRMDDKRLIPLFNQMTPADMSSAAGFAGIARNGMVKVSNPQIKAELLAKINNPNIDVGNDEIDMSELSEIDKGKYLELNNEKKSNSPKWQKSHDEFATTQSLISKLAPNSIKKNKQKLGQFSTDVENALEKEKEITGKYPDPEKKRKIIEMMSVGVVIDHDYLSPDDRVPLNELTEADIAGIDDITEVDKDSIDELTAEYKAGGLGLPTPEDFIAYHQDKLRKMTGKN